MACVEKNENKMNKLKGSASIRIGTDYCHCSYTWTLPNIEDNKKK